MFIDDSLYERLWVDNEGCACFVQNVLTAFGTKQITFASSGECVGVVVELFHVLDKAMNMDTITSSRSPAIQSITSRDDEASNLSQTEVSLEATDFDERPSADVGIKDRLIVIITTKHTFICRYSGDVATRARDYAMSILTEWCSRRVDILPRSLLRTLIHCSGLWQMRHIVVAKMDTWLQNTKVSKLISHRIFTILVATIVN